MGSLVNTDGRIGRAALGTQCKALSPAARQTGGLAGRWLGWILLRDSLGPAHCTVAAQHCFRPPPFEYMVANIREGHPLWYTVKTESHLSRDLSSNTARMAYAYPPSPP